MLLSSSNRKYQTFPLLYISVVVCLRCLLYHILSLIAYIIQENWEFILIIIVQFMMSANSRIRYGLQIVFVCLTLNLWNACQIYFVECVSKIGHMLLVIHCSIYVAVCFQLTQFPRNGWESILLCLIIIIKSEVWTIIHCLGLGHETMVCAVCLFIFIWMRFIIPLKDLVTVRVSDILCVLDTCRCEVNSFELLPDNTTMPGVGKAPITNPSSSMAAASHHGAV